MAWVLKLAGSGLPAASGSCSGLLAFPITRLGVTQVLTAPWLVYGGSHRSLEDKRTGLIRFADEVIVKM